MDSYKIERITQEEYNSYQEHPFFPAIIENDSLWLVKRSDKDNSRYIKIWISVQLEVTQYLKDEDTNEKFLNITAKTPFGLEEEVISADCLNKKDITQLQKKWFFNEAYSDILIRYLIQASEQAPRVILYKSIGWFQYKNNLYFRTNRVLHNKELASQFQYAGDLKLDNKISSKSTYLNALNNLLTTDGSMFAVVAGLSSALLSYLKLTYSMENILIHIYGDSSSGKSTFLKLALSMWGNPNEPPLFNEWNSTTNAIYAALSNNQGITVGFDEASCSALDYSTLIYNLSHGRDKARCNKDSSLRESKTWSTTIISTAEESLLTKTKKNNGIRARCLEFDNLHITQTAEHAEKIDRLISHKNGIVGEDFVSYLYSKQPRIVFNDFKLCQKYLSRKLQDKACQITDRVIKHYAVLLQTALYALRIGMYIDTRSIVNVLMKQHEYLRDETKTAESLHNAICEYIVTHKKLFPEAEELRYDKSSPCEGITTETSVLLIESVLQKIIYANNFTDMKMAVKWLCKEGYLKKQSGKYYLKRTISGVSVKVYEILQIDDDPEPKIREPPKFTGIRVQKKNEINETNVQERNA